MGGGQCGARGVILIRVIKPCWSPDFDSTRSRQEPGTGTVGDPGLWQLGFDGISERLLQTL